MPIIKKEKGDCFVPQPADEEMEQVALAVTDLNELDEDTCYCCFEKKDTAHVSYKIKLYLKG